MRWSFSYGGGGGFGDMELGWRFNYGDGCRLVDMEVEVKV